VARGMKSGAFRSTTFIADESNVIPSSSVHIIRVTSKNILPEYLSHYLNSKEGQGALSQIISGSYIGALPRKELENIDIPIPSLQKQDVLINLFRNLREQQKIIDRKKEIKQNITNAIFNSLTTT
jgi:restriction endonuclease S subunit